MTVTLLLFTIPQEDVVHEIVRGVMSCTFTLCFVFTFYKISSLSSQVEDDQLKVQVQSLFRYSFIFFVIAEGSWLVDNAQCPSLRKLPFYPHLHAVWHFFAASGMYGLCLCVVLLKWANPLQRNVKLSLWNGVIPHAVILKMKR